MTDGTGPLDVTDEVRLLRGVLADLESVTLYHGSADAAFKLDETRVLATSASPAIAARYSTGFTTHSVENYLKTPSGRPGKIGEAGTNLKTARKTLAEAQKNLDTAQKELRRAGQTQWDVNLLQQTIDEQKAIIKRAGAAERSAERRVSTLDDATDELLTDMIAAKNAGNTVEIRTKNGWRKVESLDWKQIRIAEEGVLKVEPELFRRSVFRVQGTMNKPQAVRVYGEALYLTKWTDIPPALRDTAFGGKAANYKNWVKSKGWNNPDDAVTKYMRENGFGRAVVQDDALAGGVSNIVLPEAVAANGRKRSVERSITEMQERAAIQAAEDLPLMDLEPQAVTPKQRRLARVAARKAMRRQEAPISPYYTRDNINAMINNGVEDAAENLANLYTRSHAYLDDISSRLNSRIMRAESNAIKQRTGYGYMEIEANGYKYEVPEVFQDATWFMGRTSAEDSWNALIGTQEMAFSTGIGARTVSLVKNNDPRYFEAWSNVLNMHFRDPETGIMDPIVRRILDGETDQDILGWLTRNKEGRLYANDTYTTPAQRYGLTALKGGELDED